MKKWLLLFFMCLSNITFAVPAEVNSISLNGLSMIKLSKVNKNSINLVVHYPGENYSHLCSIIMRGAAESAQIEKNFARRFTFTKAFSSEPMPYEVDKYGVLIFKLTSDSYVDGLIISTVDKKSIASNIAAVYATSDGLHDDLGIFAGGC